MATTVLLLKASANRVYGQASYALAGAELATFAGALDAHWRSERRTLGGVDYVALDHERPLTADELAVLSNLSSLHAAFTEEGDLLRPVPIDPRAVLSEDITTIQRYPGKTNEAFTHLLVNVALAAGGALPRLLAGERLRLLDPACGRGTTLNRAAVYGMDACGIELDQRDVEAYTVFLLTWLKDHRLKHKLDQAKLRKGRDRPAHRITVTYGESKDRRAHRTIDVVHDDTLAARTHWPARSMDLLVCDLPYGVQHGAHGSHGPAPTLDRGPAGLLRRALPVWFDLLRPGAGVALAWNRKTMARGVLEELVLAAGFERAGPGDPEAFVHRVDQAITRDVLVAVRPVPGRGQG